MAKQVINERWFLLYASLYVYAIWDSYRGSVALNQQYILADREDASIRPFVLKTYEQNPLDTRNPLLASALSLLAPGLGHLYVNKLISGMFFIAWTIVVMYFSHALPAVQATMLGHYDQAIRIVNMQWLMYLPSIYGFVLHDAFVAAVELNKLAEKEQSKFLRDNYQPSNFKMPL